MATLQQTWDQSVTDFNATFKVPNNVQGASVFGANYYAGGITVTKPSGEALYGVGAVLADFVATCPQFNPTNITTMDELWGKVIGEGRFSDKDHPNPQRTIHFVFTWVKDSFGNWTATHASANNKPASDAREVESVIRTDPRLSSAQKKELIAVYRRFVDEREK